MSARRTGVADPTCWGLFREREHSPGRESDDAEILRLTGKHLEAHGVQVELRAPEELVATEAPPDGVFFMCERMEALGTLLAWQERGVRLVNSPLAVLNTYRERMIAQLREANVAFVPSRLVATERRGRGGPRCRSGSSAPTSTTRRTGDVVFAETAGRGRRRARRPRGPRHRGRGAAAARGRRPHQVLRRRPRRRRAGRRAALVPLVLPQGPAPGRPPLRPGAGSRASCATPPPRSASRSTGATPSPPRTARSSSSTSTRGPASRSTATRPRR